MRGQAGAGELALGANAFLAGSHAGWLDAQWRQRIFHRPAPGRAVPGHQRRSVHAGRSASGLQTGCSRLVASRRGRSSGVVYSVFDGNTLLGTATVDQTALPTDDETVTGKDFKTLGTWTIKSDVVRVVLTDAAGGLVQADAVRVVSGSEAALLGALTASPGVLRGHDENGVLVVAVLDTAKTLYFPCASIGVGPTVVGAQLTSASYGS